MYKTTGQKNSRIEVADALRGFAVAGIILFHSVEHFNTFARDIKYTLPCDGTVFNILQALLSRILKCLGKQYYAFPCPGICQKNPMACSHIINY